MRFAVACLLGIGLVGCNDGPAPAPIVVGHVFDGTRTDKAGEHAKLAMTLALHELDKNGLKDALGGRPLQIRHTDTRGVLDAFEAEGVRLVSVNRAVALFGGLEPKQAAALDHAQAPLLTFDGLVVAGTGSQAFYFGMAPGRQGDVLARVVAEDAKIQRVVILSDERQENATALTDAFTRAVGDARGKDGTNRMSVLTLRFGKEVKWPDFLKPVAGLDPQAILFAGSVQDFNAWRRSSRQDGFLQKRTLIYAGEDGAQASFDPEPTESVVLATAFFADTEKAQAFVNSYRENYGGEADVHAALAYDGVRVLAEALKRAQPQLTPDRVREEMLKTDKFEGLTGPLTVAPDHGVQRALFVMRWQAGALTLIKKLP
jgi:ABC-type branched-subunit amino acid transport system substrate-binding protein